MIASALQTHACAIEKKRLVRASLLSVAIHFTTIFTISLITQILPNHKNPPTQKSPPTITLISKPIPSPAKQTPYLATTKNQQTTRPPVNPVFESDKNTLAATQLPQAANLPLPSQEGENLPNISFQNLEYSPGPIPAENPIPSHQTQTHTPDNPYPHSKIATHSESPIQPAKGVIPSNPATTPPANSRPLTTPTLPPSPADRQPEAYQPQTRVTRLRGGISNRGLPSAAAAATPLGKYRKQISDAIGMQWYAYVNNELSLLVPGTVEIRFTVLADGKVKILEILRNTSNTSFEATSVRAILDAQIPPIPPDLLPVLQDGRIEVDFSFSILSR